MITSLLSKIFQTISEAVFPSKCLVCGDFFQPPQCICDGTNGHNYLRAPSLHLFDCSRSESSLSRYLCPQCTKGLTIVQSPLCSCCGLPFKSRQGDDHMCGDCIDSPKKFRIARASMVYEKIFTEVIHCFKYKSKIQLTLPLSELLLTTFRLFWDKDDIDIVVPVPLHYKRLRQRGFNQAYLLIRNWKRPAAAARIDFSALRIERDVLVRTSPTAPQPSLGRSRRTANVKGAFEVIGQEKIENKRILLVDDVYTTGATVNECARMLLKHGAEDVDVLTLARAV